MTSMTSHSGRPTLRVVRGEATSEDVAALVAVLAPRAAAGTGSAGRPGAAPPAGRGRRTGWADRTYGLRAPLAPGPGAWRASARPR
ncbi:MAG TPA: acyl-CoA carboxylase subunit epsilon [Streptosporangiaceae bacterium]